MEFKKADWIHNTNVYEVNLRQYSQEGTFNAFLEELPRLKEMGIATLWFMPITPIAKKGMKGTLGSQYACSDYTAISPEFGTLKDFKRFVKKAHKMGFKVIIDWVANHTGWDHVWTVDHPEYYKKEPGTDNFRIASGMDDIIELDYDNPGLRAAMIEAMRYWVTTCDIDGFRCDLAFWVQLDFWVEARASLEETKVLFWLAESDPIENPHYYQAFDACYAWKWMHKTEEFCNSCQNVFMLNDLLREYDSIGGDDGIKLWFTSNHDENSWNGTEYEKYGGAALPLAVQSFTWNGIPLIYSGQELPNMKRLQFFEKDVIEWTGKFEQESFYKTLLHLHTTNPAVWAADGSIQTFFINVGAWETVIAYLKKKGEHEVMVLLNMTSNLVNCKVQDSNVSGSFREIFTGVVIDFTEVQSFELPAWGYLVYEKK